MRRTVLALVALLGLTACVSAAEPVLVLVQPGTVYIPPVYVVKTPVVVAQPSEKSDKTVAKEKAAKAECCGKAAACCTVKALPLYELVPARKPLLNLNLRRPQYYVLSN